jgi:hypothetical protein
MSDVIAKTGAAFKKGKSNQAIETPGDFISAVVERFGPLAFDLAANAANAQAARWYGPRGEAEDSLASTSPWTALGNLWLNPPFDPMAPWAKKCADSLGLRSGRSAPGTRIFLLSPASVGANWFRDHIHKQAMVYVLNGRLQFVGEDDPYPKDLMLSVYDGKHHGFDIWNWRRS